ncbi:ThiF family adenylyltransferase, partial [Endozoicomonas sp. G2_2]|uniref:ThiF family adenylyltransferase n=1 Tax=Endozoicomonas sp. G2_2 TaxID=2821092 RepID=UPI001ADAF6DE
MIRPRTLVLPGVTHRRLERHLFPGDGKEAAAILLCSRVERAGLKLLVRDVVEVPHKQCHRTASYLTWPGEYIDQALAAAEGDDLSILLLHSHPTGVYEFSHIDDQSDQEVIRSLIMAGPVGRNEHQPWHGSAIMVPGGEIKARVYDRTMSAHAVELVAIYGNDLRFCWDDDEKPCKHTMAFGEGMTTVLAKLSVAVVGVSGTGSVVAEQLLRMGVGELIVVDYDRVEQKNLNRILNTTEADASENVLKVDVFANAANRIRSSTRVRPIVSDISKRDAIEAVAEADIVFSCVDSLEARHICDRLVTAMLQPFFDVGVTIPVRTPARGMVISNVSGRVDYVQPGGPTLGDRGVYTPESL